ncbi:MAG: phosphatase PAP2 family protein [Anaerolineales bacterium]|nr:MAG: phosphatase PAP2 family protein [Anaerolineales bacterium]
MTMGEFLASLIPWGTGVILWVQSFRHPFFDALFLTATFLGEEEFYLIFLPFIYWCLNKQVGVGLTYITMLSHYLNSVVKLTFRLPRPSDPRLVLLRTETSPSFPSGHAQSAVANWGYLVTRFRHKMFSIVAVVLILLIAFSRIYVGVHFPQDVVGGLLIGLLLLVAYNWIVGTIEKRRFDLPLPIKLTLSAVVPLALLFAHPFDVDGTYPASSRPQPWARFWV